MPHSSEETGVGIGEGDVVDVFEERGQKHQHCRAAAKQEIENVWRERRLQRQREQQSIDVDTASVPARTSGSSACYTLPSCAGASLSARTSSKSRPRQASNKKTANRPCAIPSLCWIVQRACVQHVKQHQHRTRQPSGIAAKSRAGKSSRSGIMANASAPSGSTAADTPFFPSVLSILQANALVHHVEGTFLQDDKAFTDGDTLRAGHVGVDDGCGAPPQMSVLAGDCDFQRGLVEMCQGRDRAFYVVDVAAVVRRLVELREIYPEVAFTHPAIPNHPKLQRILTERGLHLVMTESWIRVDTGADNRLATAAAEKTVLLDDTLRTGKPDGHVRKFLQCEESDGVLVVDGAAEVRRVVAALKRFRRRRRGCNGSVHCRGFILRLPESEGGADSSCYSAVLRETLTALEESRPQLAVATDDDETPEAHFPLVGLSFDTLAYATVEKQLEGEGVEASLGRRQETAAELVDQLLSWHRLQCTRKETSSTGPLIRVDLTGFGSFPLDPSWVSWWRSLLRTHSARTVQITVDCSNLLMPAAGALCTRIIGVRQTNPPVAAVTTVPVHRHYYIDDGCYGSLYQQPGGTTNAFQPVPLLSPIQQSQVAISNTGEKTTNGGGDGAMILSTVWGPTCDGLDRVCRDILLPELHRDDWLVFFPSSPAPTTPCGSTRHGRRFDDNGNGTSFNGFEPPDTAYCVLGYFPK